MTAGATRDELLRGLSDKALWVRRETLKIHGRAPETRVASSLSAVEIFVALHYTGVMRFNAAQPRWEGRDRLIISKGHGSICYYPILADLGYFDPSELDRVGSAGSFLGGIPDTLIPGYETINGSLGHGLGVACGMALALKQKGSDAAVFVLLGDGELYEGSVWEAIMFAAHHGLDNLVAIVDNNRTCMLDRVEKVLALEPLARKFAAFDWEVRTVDGHSLAELHDALALFKRGGERPGRPSMLIADTAKGKGVPFLEEDSMSHLKSMNQAELATALEGLPCAM